MALTDTNGLEPAAALELPETVQIGGTPRLTPNELRFLKVATGRTLSDLFGDEADAMQAMVWLKLRRAGHHVTWEQAGDVEADMTDGPPDPTKVGTLPTSPLSADIGG
jgi:hypothetical protein